jgi:hypothetical protein
MYVGRLAWVSLIIGCLSANSFAVDEYRLDDGVAESIIGIQNGGTLAWLNRFQVTPGEETITAVNVAFGMMPDNSPVDVYLWGDFNNDGDPSDAFVLSALADLTANSNTNTFNVYDITDVTLNVGDYFYVGAIADHASGQSPARIDYDGTDSIPNYPPDNHSWIAGDSSGIDPDDLAGADLPLALVTTALGQDGNWLVRANAVPEPGTLSLLAVGLAIGLRRARAWGRP